MSELTMDELQAETGELLPERETLGVFIINSGGAEATQGNINSPGSFNQAVNIQPVVVANSGNSIHHTNIFTLF